MLRNSGVTPVAMRSHGLLVGLFAQTVEERPELGWLGVEERGMERRG